MHTPLAEELGRAAMDDRSREAARVALESAALPQRKRRWAHVVAKAFHGLSAVARARLRRDVGDSGPVQSSGRP